MLLAVGGCCSLRLALELLVSGIQDEHLGGLYTPERYGVYAGEKGAAAEGNFGLVVVEVNNVAANFGVRECRGFWCKVYRHFVYRGYTSPQRPLPLPLL